MAKIIDLGHGAGGIKMHELIREAFGARFAGYVLENPDDSAVLLEGSVKIAFTTDSYVVRPLFFPGGDIGRLSVCGTVNDLAMAGAVARWLSVAFVIEEGLEESVLIRVSESIAAAAREAGVEVVTGDTKVVERGSADGMFITTSGIGFVPPDISCSGKNVAPDMAILISGTVGDHETSILNAREGLVESGELVSDCAPLNGMTAAMLAACPETACMRDPTRGGLATTLNEIARQAGVGIEIDEKSIPVKPAVKGLCDLLGMDPLYMANEGKLIAFVGEYRGAELLKVMKNHSLGAESTIIGRTVAKNPGLVVLNTSIGGKRTLDMLTGKPVPRIC